MNIEICKNCNQNSILEGDFLCEKCREEKRRNHLEKKEKHLNGVKSKNTIDDVLQKLESISKLQNELEKLKKENEILKHEKDTLQKNIQIITILEEEINKKNNIISENLTLLEKIKSLQLQLEYLQK